MGHVAAAGKGTPPAPHDPQMMNDQGPSFARTHEAGRGVPLGLANWLTILRILLIPVFVSLMVYRRVGLALTVFLLAAVTDALDGYIARTHGRKTRLGAFLDPMADKLLLTASFMTLTYRGFLPFWITAVVLSRDLLLMLGAVLVHMSGGEVTPAPTFLGKATTAIQMATVLVAILVGYSLMAKSVRTAFVWATAITTVVSGAQYFSLGSRMLNGSRETDQA